MTHGVVLKSTWPCWPARRSATATASSSALCASIGPRTTSPMAHTPGRLVRHSSFTTTAPRSSSFSPTASAFNPLVLGTRPIDTMRRSQSRVRASHHDLVTSVHRLAERATAMEEGDLVLLEEIDDAVVVLLHDGVLAAQHLRQIHAHLPHVDAMRREVMLRVFNMLAGLQQG